MTAPIPRIYVERISDIQPDTNSGNVKLTFATRSHNSNQEVVQLIMHVNDLRPAFAEVFEVVQKTFFDPMRKSGAATPGQPAAGGTPGPSLNDITDG